MKSVNWGDSQYLIQVVGEFQVEEGFQLWRTPWKVIFLMAHEYPSWLKLHALTHFMLRVSFHTSWKHQKSIWFSDVLRGYRKRPLAWNWLTNRWYNFCVTWKSIKRVVFRTQSNVYVGAFLKKLHHRCLAEF